MSAQDSFNHAGCSPYEQALKHRNVTNFLFGIIIIIIIIRLTLLMHQFPHQRYLLLLSKRRHAFIRQRRAALLSNGLLLDLVLLRQPGVHTSAQMQGGTGKEVWNPLGACAAPGLDVSKCLSPVGKVLAEVVYG